MDNGIQIVVAPTAFILYFFDFLLVTPFENSIACYVVSLLDNIFLDCPEHITVVDTYSLEKRKKVVWGKCAVRTAVRLSRSRKRFRQKFLARVGSVTAATTVCIATYVAVGVTDVVLVFFLELLVCYQLEAAPPEHQTLVQAQAYSFQEESVLQTTIMLEM